MKIPITINLLKNNKISSREVAYIAYILALKEEFFIGKALNFWAECVNPPTSSLSLAYEIAQGSCRMALTLDHIALALSSQKRLKLKLKERALLRISLYQLFFLGNAPHHAIGDESVKLAKKYNSSFFAEFVNALIRKGCCYKKEDFLPLGNCPKKISLRSSFPLFFVEKIVSRWGSLQGEEILASLNVPKTPMARKRYGKGENFFIHTQEDRNKAIESSLYYIQNMTPALIVEHLVKATPCTPAKILDLCAAPGGKLLLAEEHYPKADLTANDVSKEKIELLKSNLTRFGIQADIHMGKGEEFSSKELFDLIILDVPCSNSGVLHKKAEARWRLSEENIKAINTLQERLLLHALTLLKPSGVIWYMTCSILPEENLDLLEEIQHKGNFKIHHPLTILPERDQDGGFGCLLLRKIC